MNKFIYAVYDIKTKLFGNPFYSVRQEAAIRDFGYAANDPTTEICRYAADFGLFLIGTYDDQKGTIVAMDQPEHIASALQLKNALTED